MGKGSKYARKLAAKRNAEKAAGPQPEPEATNPKGVIVPKNVTIVHDHSLLYPTLGMSVFISEREEFSSFAGMFARSGCKRTENLDTADLVVFTGGADVDPQLYGEKPIKETQIDSARDKRDLELYAKALEANIPMFGVCRGAQFLHVMNGGKLYQHVDGHIGKHSIRDTITHEVIGSVSSTHHQMCIEQKSQTVLAVAWESKERIRGDGVIDRGRNADVEAFFYEKTCCLGVQGHPEYANYPKFTVWTLGLIDHFICHNPKVDITEEGRFRFTGRQSIIEIPSE